MTAESAGHARCDGDDDAPGNDAMSGRFRVPSGRPEWSRRRLLSVVIALMMVTSGSAVGLAGSIEPAVSGADAGDTRTAANASSAAHVTGDLGLVDAGALLEGVELEFAPSPTVYDRVDKDGDGYVSSFKVRWNADTLIREPSRPDRSRDIPEDNIWNKPGQPKFALFGIVPQGDKYKRALLGIKQVPEEKRTNDETIEMRVDLLDKKLDRSPQGNELVKTNGIEGFALTYVESDSGPETLVLKDVNTMKATVEGTFGVGKLIGGVVLVATGAGAGAGTDLISSSKSNFIAVGKSIKKSWTSDDYIKTKTLALDEPIKMEKPSQDATKQLEVTSNVRGATVSIDGERAGTTPWTGTYPVDHSKRNGDVTVQVSADGYDAKTRSVTIDDEPGQSERFDLAKTQKPLVVDAEPSNATVYIDGTAVGNPPIKRSLWVEESVDIWINATGYTNENFEDVTTPRTIDVNLTTFDYYDPTYTPVTDFSTTIYDFDYLNFDLAGTYWANFSYGPRTVRTGDNVSFDGTPSTSFGSNITTYDWKFGDGVRATGARPTHAYDSAGTYPVNLTITTSAGNKSAVEKSIQVENAPPSAKYLASARSVVRAESVTFDASLSADPENAVVRYAWDFDGDGQTDTTGQRVQHAFGTAGTYQVSLTVTDDAGQTDTATKTITVVRPNTPPQPRISPSSTSPVTNSSVTFDASASRDPDGSIQTYRWEFGDGTRTNGEVVSHAYDRRGNYSVTLLTIDDRGEIATTTKILNVTAASTAEESTQQDQSGENQTRSDTGQATTDQVQTTTEPGTSGEATMSTETGGTETTTGAGGPGFGTTVAVLALLGMGVLALRRDGSG